MQEHVTKLILLVSKTIGRVNFNNITCQDDTYLVENILSLVLERLIPRTVRCYTMDVICSTGFGLDVSAQTNPDNPFIKYSKRFLETSPLGMPKFILYSKTYIFYRDIHGRK